MSSAVYQLNCAQYVLYRDGKPVTAPCDEIALAIGKAEGILHKHGKPESVRTWVAQSRAKLLESAASLPMERRALVIEMANDLTVLQGRFTLDDLNRCLSTTGYAKTLYEKAMAGTLESLNIMGTTHFRTPAAA